RATTRFRAALALLAIISFAACSDFLNVKTPSVIDAGNFDPSADPTVASLSAQQNFATAAGLAYLRAAFVVGEAWNGFPTVQLEDFGLRSVAPDNPLLSSDVWAPLELALSSADKAANLLQKGTSDNARSEERRVGKECRDRGR